MLPRPDLRRARTGGRASPRLGRALLALGLALAGCRGASHDRRAAPAGSGATARPARPPAADPWAARPAADDAPPDLGKRHQLAEQLCPKVTGPYFYRVEKAGHVSYLLGTRHVSVPLAKFPPVVHDDIDHARLAVFEVAPGDDAHVDRPDLDLRGALGPKLWAQYVALVGHATARGVAHGRASAALLLMMVMYEDPSAMLDDQLEQEALTHHVPTRGLETARFQDDLLDHLLDLRMLRATVEGTPDRGELARDSAKDLRAYCAGTDDTPGMDAHDRAQLRAAGYTDAELDAMDDELVFSRNRSWIPKLAPMLAAGGTFVAVGADHLIGAKGVVALLRARGFTITRVTR